MAAEAADLRQPDPVAVERHDLVQALRMAGDAQVHVPDLRFSGWATAAPESGGQWGRGREEATEDHHVDLVDRGRVDEVPAGGPGDLRLRAAGERRECGRGREDRDRRAELGQVHRILLRWRGGLVDAPNDAC